MTGWYSYIAKHRPDAIYQLYKNQDISSSKLVHLIKFGLLPDWDKHIENPENLVLRSNAALSQLAMSHGVKNAQRIFIDAFINPRNFGKRLDIENLRFALPAMNGEEIVNTVNILKDGGYSVDPRDLYRLMLGFEFQDRKNEFLSIMSLNAHSSRSMSSYFTDGATWGEIKYVHKMLNDLPDNAGQPNNFYCSACGLALVSDGILGTPLMRLPQDNTKVIQGKNGQFFILKTNK